MRSEELAVHEPAAPASEAAGSFEINGLTKQFQGLRAVDGVTFDIAPALVTSIIGPNGAGKTTLFNMITGVTRPTAGSIRFSGRDITGWPPHRIVEAGVGRTFQNIQLFQNLNVLENVIAARYCRTRATFVESLLFLGRDRRERRENVARADQVLEWAGVAKYRLHMPRELSYGDQRRVEIARALATEPTTLMLDEPSAGMVDREAFELMALLRRLSTEGKTVILIEHNMRLVMGVSDTVVVLNFGKKIAEGTPSVVQSDPNVLESYLGSTLDRGARGSTNG